MQPGLFETTNLKRILRSSHQKKFVKACVVIVLAWALKNTYKSHFLSKVAGRTFLRINFFIDTTQPTFQRPINVVATLWITVEITLIRRWKWNKIRSRIFNVAQHWYNVGVQRRNNVKSTLDNLYATVFRRWTMSFQHCFNVVSTSVKAISKPIWLVKSMDLQKDW